MNDTLLEVSGVSKSFDGFKAINNLSIQIAAVSYTHLTLPTILLV